MAPQSPSSSSAHASLVLRQPLSKLTFLGRALDTLSGSILILTGLLGALDAVQHVQASTLEQILLALYCAGAGAALLAQRFARGALAATIRRDYGFLHSLLGRSLFVLLIANLAWTCAPLGVYAAIVTNGNAVLSLYVLFMHPELRGRRLVIEGDEPGADEPGGTELSSKQPPAAHDDEML